MDTKRLWLDVWRGGGGVVARRMSFMVYTDFHLSNSRRSMKNWTKFQKRYSYERRSGLVITKLLHSYEYLAMSIDIACPMTKQNLKNISFKSRVPKIFPNIRLTLMQRYASFYFCNHFKHFPWPVVQIPWLANSLTFQASLTSYTPWMYKLTCIYTMLNLIT